MTNYPNMSYCMCSNTALALEQVLGNLLELGPEKFAKELTGQERREFLNLVAMAGDLVKIVEESEEFDTV